MSCVRLEFVNNFGLWCWLDRGLAADLPGLKHSHCFTFIDKYCSQVDQRFQLCLLIMGVIDIPAAVFKFLEIQIVRIDGFVFWLF